MFLIHLLCQIVSVAKPSLLLQLPYRCPVCTDTHKVGVGVAKTFSLQLLCIQVMSPCSTQTNQIVVCTQQRTKPERQLTHATLECAGNSHRTVSVHPVLYRQQQIFFSFRLVPLFSQIAAFLLSYIAYSNPGVSRRLHLLSCVAQHRKLIDGKWTCRR